MGNLFGRKKQSRVTEQDRAILVRGRRREGRGGAWGWTPRGKLRRAGSGAGPASGAIARPAADTPGPGRAKAGEDPD
ncbi:hypothetical protein U0070_001926 [Myodes glareolus]|uniref:Uncharacterized protein n=1 Tax=Myodes glareolus TaxID=447135 RepID=A0AAW0HK33_MYOGA